MKRFFSELKRRNIYKVGATYLITAFIVLQVADLTFENLGLPSWSITLLIVLIIIGFPLALIFTWAIEITPEGIRRSEKSSFTLKKGWLYALTGVITLGIVWWLFAPFSTQPPALAEQEEVTYSIATLPFNNLANDESQSAITNGMADILNTNLANVEGLRAISRNSVAHYMETKPLPEMVEELDLDYLIEGSLQLFDEQILINIQLMDARSSEYIWTNSYEKDFGDLFLLQKEIAQDILDNIKEVLVLEEPVVITETPRIDPEALKLYLEAMEESHQASFSDYQRAEELLEQSILIDSTFAPAHASLSIMRTMLSSTSGQERLYKEKAEESFEKAFELNSGLASAYRAKAMFQHIVEHDWEGAEDSFKRSLQINPASDQTHHQFAHFLLRMGRFEEAIEAENKAIYLSPASSGYQSGLGEIYLFKREYERAIEEMQKGIQLNPSRSIVNLWLVRAYTYNRNFEKAFYANKELLGLGTIGYKPFIYAYMGEVEKARNYLSTLEEEKNPSHFIIAMTYAALEDDEKTIEWLTKAYNQNNGWLTYLKVEPIFDSVRDHPQYKRIIQNIFGVTF